MKPEIKYNVLTELYEAKIGEIVVCTGTHDECSKALDELGYPYY